MAFLERCGLCHLDLAARNVLVDHADTNLVRIKLVDYFLPAFGMTDVEWYAAKKRRRMPYEWMAIESLIHKRLSIKTDVWTYGIFLCEVFMDGEKPYRVWDPPNSEKSEKKSQSQTEAEQESMNHQRTAELAEALAAVTTPARLVTYLLAGKRHPKPADTPSYVAQVQFRFAMLLCTVCISNCAGNA